MKKALVLLVLGTIVSAVGAFAANGQAAPPKVTLTRLDCGSSKEPREIAAFSDTRAYDGVKKALVASCYLVRHGDDYLLWDTGYPASNKGDAKSNIAMPATILDQLRTLGVDPAQVRRVGISHYHGDHTGQLPDFTSATLLIGSGDWAAVSSTPPAAGVDPKPFAAWTGGTAKVEPVARDRDIFGDGTVVMLDTPGHTPGHHSLLVRLAGKGNVLLTGDLSHFNENYATNGVPTFNTNRADTLASLDRFKAMAKNLKATVIIQHEPGDIAKLPAFPKAAE